MAVPKKKHTRGRRRSKLAHKSLVPTAVRDCPQCGSAKRPHRVCPTCGFYRQREVLKLLDE